jgi:hypothetical protein
MTLHQRFKVLSCLAAAPLLFAASAAFAQTTSSGNSENVVWNCTGSPCPWGSTDSGLTLVWPQNSGATSIRHGYTTTKPVYLPAYAANGAVVKLNSGTATLYAGAPLGGSHRTLTTISAGGIFTVTGLGDGEVLSVQGGSAFSWQVTLPTVSPPPSNPPPTEPPPSEPPPSNPPPSNPPPTTPPATLSSVAVTWSCTGSPCPWGATDSGIAIEWPNVPERVNQRYGYTTSKGVYLGAARANGATITLLSGTAGVYAGTANAQHRMITTLAPGGTLTVSGLAAGEILSVQSSSAFTYQLTLPAYTPPPPTPGTPSQLVTWLCTGTPCPMGGSVSQQALVWPASTNPTKAKLGYTAAQGVYLPHNWVAGTTISVKSGTATAYVDAPAGTLHNEITTISAGGTYTFTAISACQVLSLVGNAEFSYELTLGTYVGDPPPPPANVIVSTPTEWRCGASGCSGNWYSHTIPWPSWSAYSDNARLGDKYRKTYGTNGEVLHPYMGKWAHGCRVTAVTGTVLIIEWQRGSEWWTETYLDPGQSHTINLTPPYDGAMIESYDNSPGFSVTLQNCDPKPLP